MGRPLGVAQGLGDVLRELVLALSVHLGHLEAGPRMALCAGGQQLRGAVAVSLLQQSLAQGESGVRLILLEGQTQEPLALPTVLLCPALDALRQNAAEAALRATVAQLGGAPQQLQGASGVGPDAGAWRRLPSPVRLGVQCLRLVLSTRPVEPLSRLVVVPLGDQRHGQTILRGAVPGLRRLLVPGRGAVDRRLGRVLEEEEELRAGALLHLHAVVEVVPVRADVATAQRHEPPVQEGAAGALNEEAPSEDLRVLEAQHQHREGSVLVVRRHEAALLGHVSPEPGCGQRGPGAAELLAHVRQQRVLDQRPQHVCELATVDASFDNVHAKPGPPICGVGLARLAGTDELAQDLRSHSYDLSHLVVRKRAL
mmetsp:Transcript_99207/g.305848  ORF Transcript_99207/g.305848 Transcript_99207/m.305848 type:complete len:369 (+) Transcript_99207:955-2061(+)